MAYTQATTYETPIKDGWSFRVEHYLASGNVTLIFLDARYEVADSFEIAVEDTEALAQIFKNIHLTATTKG